MKKEELIEHMNKYKDALIIFGEKGLHEESDFDAEILNNKIMKREPKKFWDHYFEKVCVDIRPTYAQKAVSTMIEKSMAKDVINLTTKDIFHAKDVINLHGLSSEFKCTSCKLVYPQEYFSSFEKKDDVKCEVCGKLLRPNILLSGETYYEEKYARLKQLLLDTHTVFLIGMNWDEDAIVSLVADFGEMKDVKNATEEEKRYIVSVGTDDYIDISNIANFEFIVPGNINESMERFMDI